MDKGIVVVPIERRASWARRFVQGVDDRPAVEAQRAPLPPRRIETYNLRVAIDVEHDHPLTIVARVRERLADMNPRGIEIY